jgi:hypothetical protein
MAKRIKSIKEVIGDKNPSLKSTWADYAASHLRPKRLIYRFDDKKGNRFYFFKDDNGVTIGAGITTVLDKVLPYDDKKYIEKWKENTPNWRQLFNTSGEYGTLEHIVHGDIMFQKGVDKSKLEAMQDLIVSTGGSVSMPTKDILAFMRFQEDYQLIPLLIEASLAWQDPTTGEWLMMTIDLLAKMVVTIKTKTQIPDGVYQRGVNAGQPRFKDITTEEKIEKILLVDFKGNFFDKEQKGFYKPNKMQLQGAKLAVEQNFDIKVDDVYNYSPNNWRTEPSYTFYKWELTDKDWEKFYSYWKTAQLEEYHKPEGKMLITEGFKDSSDYKFLSYKEYVEQVLCPKDIVTK